MDDKGNAWVGGESAASVDLGITNLTLLGSSMATSVGLSLDGTFSRGIALTGQGSAYISKIQSTDAGLILAGAIWNNSEIDFGGYTNAVTPNQTGFIAIYDTDQRLIWQITTTNDSPSYHNESIQSIAVTPNGDIVGFGLFGGPMVEIGSKSVENVSRREQLLLFKANKDGEVIMARGYGGIGEEHARDIAVDSAGNFVICGFFAGEPFTLGSNILMPEGLFDGFLAKLDSAGNPLWAKSISSAGLDWYDALVVDRSSDEIIVVGRQQLSGQSGMIIRKYSPAGDMLWELTENLQSFGSCQDVALDSHGNILACGASGLGPVVWKVSSTGKVLWKKYSSEVYIGESFQSVVVAPDDSIFLACQFSSPTMTLDDFSIPRVGTNSFDITTVITKLAADPPTLQHQHGIEGIVLSWPTNRAGFQLEANTLSLNPQDWLPVSTFVEDGRNAVTNSISEPGMIFRLRKDAPDP